jgi:RNA polymerase primary sigma factor
LGLSQKQFAKVIGLTLALVSAAENLHPIPDRVKYQYSTFAEMDVEYLFPPEIRGIKTNKLVKEVTFTELQLANSDKLLFDENTPETRLKQAEFAKDMRNVLNTLGSKEESVLRNRFFNDMTHDEIAKQMEVTPTRIIQIEAKGLRKLRHQERSSKIIPHIWHD